MTLDAVPLGARFRIAGLRVADTLACRLMEMGMLEGAEVQVVRRAPLGDPLQIRVGDSELSVRTSEAALIDVWDMEQTPARVSSAA